MKIMKVIAAVAALMACIAMLAGCSNTNGDTNNTTAPNNEPTTETTAAPEVEEDVIGKVETISDSFVTLVIYTATGEIADYATLNISGLSATEDTDYVYTASTAKYFKVVNGVKTEAKREDLQLGAMIAATTDSEGVQQIFIYSDGQGNTTDATEETGGAVA